MKDKASHGRGKVLNENRRRDVDLLTWKKKKQRRKRTKKQKQTKNQIKRKILINRRQEEDEEKKDEVKEEIEEEECKKKNTQCQKLSSLRRLSSNFQKLRITNDVYTDKPVCRRYNPIYR